MAIAGIPRPEVGWQKNDVDISPSFMVNGTNFTSLSISDVQQSDAGRYRLSAINCADSATEMYNVFIRCKSIEILVVYVSESLHYSSAVCEHDKEHN